MTPRRAPAPPAATTSSCRPRSRSASKSIADGPDRIKLEWEIAPGYYLYRSRLKVSTDPAVAQLGALSLPKGQLKSDEYFGEQEVFHDRLSATCRSRATARADRAAGVGGLPGLRRSRALLSARDAPDCGRRCRPASAPLRRPGHPALPGRRGAGRFVSEQDRLADLIRDGNLRAVLATFFGLGLLLAFTPCVLPMVPILSGIIVGQGDNVTTRPRVHAVAGLRARHGVHLHARRHRLRGRGPADPGDVPAAWIIVLFGLLFVCSRLDVRHLHDADARRHPDAAHRRQQPASAPARFVGAAIMGALSSLIVTACVAPPLVATLAVIGQSGDVVRGGAALFAMSSAWARRCW